MLSNSSSGAARKKTLFVLAALIAVNAAVAHIVVGQIANAKSSNQVKDAQVTVEEAAPVSDDVVPADEGHDDAPAITIYTVKSGDTISSIASKFGVSQNTVLWANEMTAKSTLKIGQALVILPFNGIQYTVKKGDTISGIAAKFDADADEILYFNDLADPTAIQPGVELLIPDAEPSPSKTPEKKTAPKVAVTPAPKSAAPTVPKPAPVTAPVAKEVAVPQVSAFAAEDTHDHSEGADTDSHEDEKKDTKEASPSDDGRYGMFITPAPGSILTQGYHAVNAVDFGGKTGAPILAAAKGTVIVAKSGCALDGSIKNNCNGGFGNFIVISHANGIQTLYAHLSKVSVTVGQSVDQGDQIGGMGDSGKSTGTHLHFETHGIKNPYTKDKKFTKY